ncbi:MAG: hypothetical protein ABWX96_20090, partial [Propionibacteriaceae bacterium]
MLYLDSALELHGLTIYRDYNTPSRYYYMPGSPRVSTDGGAQAFQLLIYRRDITDNPDFHEGDRPGGGFLTMTVDLGVPQATLNAVKAELSSRVPGGQPVDLVAVPFEEGSVRVSALGTSSAPSDGEAPPPGVADRGPRFVEEILGSAKSSLYGDNRAVFQIELSHEGALLMRASLEKGGTSQVAIVYDLAYRGLMPAYDAKITIDFKQSYSYLRTRFTANTLWFKADIDAEIEKLTKEGHIKIESADYIQADPAKLAENATKLQELAKELGAWTFFKPGLTPGKVVADDRGNLTVHDPTTEALATQPGVAAPLVAAGTGSGSPTDVAGPRTQGDSASAATTRVSGQPVPPVQAAAPATPAAGAAGTSSAVDAWNKMGRPQAGFLLRQLSQEEQQTVTYDLRQVAAQRRTAAPQGSLRLLPGAADLPGRIEEVDLNSVFFERIAGAVTSTADFAAAGVGSMVVKLRYGERDDGSTPKDVAEVSLTRAGDSTPYAFFMDRRKTMDLEYQVVVSYRDGFALGSTAPQETSEWIRTSTRNLDVDPEVVGAVFPVTLTLGSIDWTTVQSIQSTVRYAAGEDRERTVVFAQNTTGALVPIRPPAGASRDFTVETTFFYAGSTEVVTATGSGATTVVINPPTTRAVPVSISAADPLARFKKVAVELSYPGTPGHPEQTRLVELAGDAQSAAWTFFRPTDDGSARYRYRVTLFGNDGTVDVGEWAETPERQLIVGDVFEDIIEVEARFLVSDFAAAGFQGAKLTLEYPEAAPGTDGVEEEFFAGTPQPFTWRVPRPA